MGTDEAIVGGRIFTEPYCLCIGAGTTKTFVGSWTSLLGKLLGRRFVSAWLDMNNSLGDGSADPFDAIAPFIGDDCYAQFFTEEGNLELGEYLLVDDSIARPDRFTQEDAVWREFLFSAQISDIVNRSIGDALTTPCNDYGCSRLERRGKICPLADDGMHSFLDIYDTYHEAFGDCKYVDSGGDYSTAMSVVEACLAGRTRHIINYNFDTVIEETLVEALNSGRYQRADSPIRTVHIWTYGATSVGDDDSDKKPAGHNVDSKSEAADSTGPARVAPGCDGTEDDVDSARCKVRVHRGAHMSDAGCLADEDAIHIFHVHGVMSGRLVEGPTDPLVFSQHAYMAYQDAPLNWSNHVLEYLFSRYNVVGVGFSGTDENFRNFMANHRKAYLEGVQPFMERTEKDATFGRVKLLKAKQPYRDAIEKQLAKSLGTDWNVGPDGGDGAAQRIDPLVQQLLRNCTDMVDRYYGDYFGIETEWVDDFADIAKLIHADVVESAAAVSPASA